MAESQLGATPTRASDDATLSYVQGMNLYGTLAARPAAGVTNRVYNCTNCDAVYQDSGSVWNRVRIGPRGIPASGLGDPLSAGLTALTGTPTITADLDGRLLSTSASDNNWRGEHWALPSASGYTATFMLEMNALAAQLTAGAVLLLDGSNNIVSLGPVLNPGSNVSVFTSSLTTITSTPGSGTPLYLPNWFRIVDDGTNRSYQFTSNGADWATVYSASRTANITATRIGWGAYNNNASGATKLRLRSYTFTTP